MPTTDHAESVRSILGICIARVWRKQSALAAALGVAPTTVNQWLSGARSIDAADLLRVVSVTLAGTDASTALDIATFAAERVTGMDLVVERVEPDTTPRVWEREVVEGMSAEARMHQAVLDGNEEAFAAASADAERELRERIAAGRQKITGSAEGALRMVPGGAK